MEPELTVVRERRIYVMCAELLKTLANPTRLMILDLLKTGEKTVSELSQLTGRSQSNISQHLAVLKQRGVITARKEGANTYYRVASERFVEICNLIRRALYEVLREGEEIAKKLEELTPAR